MHAYPRPNERRALKQEITDHVTQTLDSTLIEGFADLISAGDAVSGGARIAGFMETWDNREWYLPLSSRAGLKWRTELVGAPDRSTVTFILAIGFGNGAPLPQPSGQWDIFVNGRYAISVRVVKHTQVWRNDNCALAFAAHRIESADPGGALTLSSVLIGESFAAFGPALLTVPSGWLEASSAAEISVMACGNVNSTRWFQLASVPNLIEQADIYDVAQIAAKKQAPEVDGYGVYFGDIHNHSGQVFRESDQGGCGVGSRADNYRYAQGPGGLDFYALTDHECQIKIEGGDGYLELAEEHNREGSFVCLPAFEFTNQLYGHRNVYFAGAGGKVINANRDGGPPTKDPGLTVTPGQLWAELTKLGVPFMTVPHHSSSASHPLTWDFFDPEFDRLAEVYSCWGSSEYYGDVPRGVADRYHGLDVRAALGRGLRPGLIASSDGHDGHPGNAQSPLIKHHHLFHHLGSGLAAVLAPQLTRHDVFDALYQRRCYATTGVPMVLSFTINGVMMGSEMAALADKSRPQLRIVCVGTNGIDHVRIVKNGAVAVTHWCHGEFDVTMEWEDAQYDASQSNYYYVRVVQIDRESAWSSPIWLG